MNRFIADSMRYFLKSSRIMALLKGNKAEESGNMMQLLSITKKYHVSKPLESSDVAELKRMGFARIICNLPDGEISGVTQSREIAAACAEAGIDFEYIPVSVTKFTPELVLQHTQAVISVQGNVLAYCATGRRCTMMWAFEFTDKHPIEHIMSIARSVDFDLSKMTQKLEQFTPLPSGVRF